MRATTANLARTIIIILMSENLTQSCNLAETETRNNFYSDADHKVIEVTILFSKVPNWYHLDAKERS